jgi:5-amino-6-(5-phosphoribosylamino)uracil reductase
VVLVGHLATFLVAARAAGSSAPIAQLVPLMLLALLAMALPVNVGGWGPREGVFAWAFGAAGLSAAQGFTIAVVYGLFAFVASLPGAGVLVARWIIRLRSGRGHPSHRGDDGCSRRPGLHRQRGSSVLERPYVLLSCGMSIDGYLDSATEKRLLLSNDADFDRVDAVRAECDAILVGAATVRQDNPQLLVRSQARRDARVARGLPPSPMKVTVTSRAKLDPAAQFFAAGDIDKLVYCASSTLDEALERLGGVATVVDGGEPVDLHWMTADLLARGVGRLMVEGGGTMHTQFLTAGLVDELHLVVAPFFVGDSRAPRFVTDGTFPWDPDHRAVLAEVRQIGDVALLRYGMSGRFGAA